MFNFNAWISAFVVSFSQLVFSDRIFSGLFVWLGLFFLYPWNALGGLLAVLIAVTIHQFLPIYTTQQQAAGWSGFNAAIVGLFWGGALANNSYSILVLLVAIVCVLAFEAIFIKILRRWSLPILSSPAMLVVLLFSILLAQNGEWYWVSVLAGYWYEMDQYLGIACLIIAMSVMNVSATGWALALAAVFYALVLIAGFDVSEHLALWALNIPLGVFAVLAVFFVAPIHRKIAAGITVVVICIIWLVWHITPLNDLVQPIVVPMICGIWSALFLVSKYQSHDYLSPRFWKLIADLRAASKIQQPIHLIHVTDRGTRAKLEQIVSRAKTGNFNYQDPELWEYGRDIKGTNFNKLLDILIKNYPIMFFDSIGTFSSLKNQKKLTNSIKALNESPDTVACILCGTYSPWPELDLWKYAPLACENCSQPLVPGSLLSWFSSNYLHKNLSNLFDHPCCIVMLTIPTDPLIEDFMSFIESKKEIKVLFVAKEIGPSDPNWEEILLARLKRINKILRFRNYLSIFSSMRAQENT